MPRKKYVVWNTQNRKGEFEFNCATQHHLCTSVKEAKELIEDISYPEDDRKSWKIYEIQLTEVKA